MLLKKDSKKLDKIANRNRPQISFGLGCSQITLSKSAAEMMEARAGRYIHFYQLRNQQYGLFISDTDYGGWQIKASLTKTAYFDSRKVINVLATKPKGTWEKLQITKSQETHNNHIIYEIITEQ